MRIDVEKCLIVGSMSHKDLFFQRVQEAGIVEFIDQRTKTAEPNAEIQTFIEALHILRQMKPTPQGESFVEQSAQVLARHVIDCRDSLEKWQEQARITRAEIARIEPFGEFSLEDIHEVEQQSKRVMQFFIRKQIPGSAPPPYPEVIRIGTVAELEYFISIHPQRMTYEGLTEVRIESSLGQLREQLAEARRQIDIYETELASLAHKKTVLQQGLANSINRHHLVSSKEGTLSLLEGEAFAVEGWVPKNKMGDLLRIGQELDVYVEPVAREKEDLVPTYLENEGPSRWGEDLVAIYDTPATTDRDPSLWVLIAFGIFFSMIIADAGYGLVLLGISLWMYHKYRKKGGFMRRLALLSTSLSIGCIIWGILLTSFFGIEFAADSPLRKLSFTDWMVRKKAEYFIREKPRAHADLIKEYPQLQSASSADALLKGVTREQEGMGKYVVYNNFQRNVLLELVIFIGTLHIMLSFLRYIDKNWAGLGWILFMVGAYLYFPTMLQATSIIHYIFHVPYASGAILGKYLMYAGLALAVVLAFIQKRVGGLAEVMHVIQVFADVMSYLRIYALSLAGAIMASTFNHIAGKVPIYIGILIILAGHTLNFVLALMGGVIHGLRLNFIEWYHYSFEGGGKKFNPLSLLKLD